MMSQDEQSPQEYPSLRGRIEPGAKLTELEREVLKQQGLLSEDGEPKPEAFKQPEKESGGISMPNLVSLEDVEPAKAAELTKQLEDIRGAHAPEAEVDDANKVDVGLAPPEADENNVADDADPGPPPGSNQTSSVAIDIETLIRSADEPVRCGYCGWDQRDSFKSPPHTEEDKLAFIRHVMSDEGRFFKTFKVFGGAMTIQLRSRTQSEQDAIMRSARQEMTDGDLAGMGDLQAQLQRYHIAASLAEVTVRDEPKQTSRFETLAGWFEKDSNCTVQTYDEYVFGKGRSTALYGVVTTAWMEFERLYGYFAARAHEPDFWKAAAGDLS